MEGDSRGNGKKINRPKLPDELVFDILSRLPVQSILRYKCVCKSWLSMISDPQFIKTHFLRSTQSPDFPRLLLATNGSFLSFDFESPDHEFKSLQRPRNYSDSCLRPVCSCDGLILLWAHDRLSFGTSCKSFVLWNPSIAWYKRIKCPYELPFRGIYGHSYDSTADDYRVLVASQQGNEISVVIYSFRNDSWNIFNDNRYGILSLENQVVVNGVVHFVIYERELRELRSCAIVYFDFVEGQFKEVPLPSFWSKDDNMNLVALGGFLCVYCDIGVELLKIFAMKEYGKKESWTRLFVMPWAIEQWVPFPTYVKPLFLTRKGQVVISVGHTGIGLYDPKARTFLWCDRDCGEMAIPYVETLLSLNGGV
ncbi:F-box/kelch-repeat protein At3g23880-like [Rhododendron vialii]|uniref:F-box/kelch-repeat protein At3g23880-like n=1 Tax=Rhododendron vialii TaxID=182163 RepID=UPI00265F14D5|nr:F-box/kelch-repeat protein At3g23880-like [Rhododendron vialii]